MITQETRAESYEDIREKQTRRYRQILERLETGNKTAKEIAVELYELGFIPSTERNYTAPSLSELVDNNLVRVVDKKICTYTGKKVAVYEITQEGCEYMHINHIPMI